MHEKRRRWYCGHAAVHEKAMHLQYKKILFAEASLQVQDNTGTDQFRSTQRVLGATTIAWSSENLGVGRYRKPLLLLVFRYFVVDVSKISATPVVLKVGSATQFSGDRGAPSKKINATLLKKEILGEIKFSGNLFFQTKLNKHNLELWKPNSTAEPNSHACKSGHYIGCR